MSKSIEEIMGEEYARSWSGQLYFAFEAAMLECSNTKFSALGKKIWALLPAEAREKVPVAAITTIGIRWAQEEPWLSIDEPPTHLTQELSATILWLAPKSGRKLVQMLREDPRRFLWEALDSFKLLSAVHNISGGWK